MREDRNNKKFLSGVQENSTRPELTVVFSSPLWGGETFPFVQRNKGKKGKELFLSPSGSGRRGMILMEVLLAMMILSVGLVAVLQSLSASLRAVVLADDFTRAALLVESRMAEKLIMNDFSGENSGEGLDGKFSYQIALETPQDLPLRLDVREARAVIRWPAGMRVQDLELATFWREPRE